MDQAVIGTLTIAGGVLLIIFRRKFTHESLAFQNKTFGFKFGKKEFKQGTLIVPLIGILWVIFGILMWLGKI